ncbi:MAG: hypothetical protein HQL23_03755 [Candidatus Omnitrophica bacterium]|nr:hypothetical protein [Candidatus Omnitrophota bacterium]
MVRLRDGLVGQIKLKYAYDVRVVDGKDSDRVQGVPFLSNHTVFFPRDFLAYVYQNYYRDRAVILTDVMTHEMCHAEFNLPSAPIEEHFKTDMAAIKLLGETPQAARDFYRSLFVVKNYWFARKGMAGHALNAGINVVSGASMVLGGPGVFVNLFATDLSRRMDFLARKYKLSSTSCFKRSSQ